MAKIGIVTLPLRLNYGCILQAYALQTILINLRNDVTLIQPKYRGFEIPHGLTTPFVYGKRAVLKFLGLSDIPVYAEKQLNEQWPVISEKIRWFVKQYVHLKEVSSYEELNSKDFDALVVGSDQVWRPAYSNLYQCFLQFAENWDIKRIAYAASFGTDEKEYSSEQIEICKSLAQKFDAISVREDSGVNLCNDYFGVQAQHVLDPTLLLDKEDYIKLVKESKCGDSKGDLFVYFLDPSKEKNEVVEMIAKKKHLTPFSVKAKNDYKYAPIEDRIQPPVEQWLRGFLDAEYVVTDSFHGCVFSIIFNKPFIAVGNAERGMARFTSLFSLLGIKERLVSCIINNELIDAPVDWLSVNRIMSNLRGSSTDFVNHNLCF